MKPKLILSYYSPFGEGGDGPGFINFGDEGDGPGLIHYGGGSDG